jgi:hypothetical protein
MQKESCERRFEQKKEKMELPLLMTHNGNLRGSFDNPSVASALTIWGHQDSTRLCRVSQLAFLQKDTEEQKQPKKTSLTVFLPCRKDTKKRSIVQNQSALPPFFFYRILQYPKQRSKKIPYSSPGAKDNTKTTCVSKNRLWPTQFFVLTKSAITHILSYDNVQKSFFKPLSERRHHQFGAQQGCPRLPRILPPFLRTRKSKSKQEEHPGTGFRSHVRAKLPALDEKLLEKVSSHYSH